MSFHSGIETSDNLNLLQPVNPWVGNEWQIYNEYYQWSPTYNFNSEAVCGGLVIRLVWCLTFSFPKRKTNPGDLLYGSVALTADRKAYNLTHTDVTDGWTVNTIIPIQAAVGDILVGKRIFFWILI